MTDLKVAAQRALNLMDLTTLNDDDTDQKGVVSQINHQAATAPAPGDRYTRGFLTGRPRVFSLFMALTYAMTSPTWPL